MIKTAFDTVHETVNRKIKDYRDRGVHIGPNFENIMTAAIFDDLQKEGFSIGGTDRGFADAIQIAGLFENDLKHADLDVLRGDKPSTIGAKVFAIRNHGAQRYGANPYAYHLDKVERVLVAAAYTSDVWKASAWLHDVVEDTPADISTVRQMFGDEVADNVWAVSGFGANRKERNADIYRKLAARPTAWTLKVSDRIANCESCREETNVNLAGMYAKEASNFESLCINHVSAQLFKRLVNAHRDCELLKFNGA